MIELVALGTPFLVCWTVFPLAQTVAPTAVPTFWDRFAFLVVLQPFGCPWPVFPGYGGRNLAFTMDKSRGFAVYLDKILEITKLEEEKEAVATTLDELTTAVAMRVGQTSQMVQNLRQEAIKVRDHLTRILS